MTSPETPLAPVTLMKLDPMDEITVSVGTVDRTVRVSEYKDPKGRMASFMLEQVDGDRFCFPGEAQARDFINIHGMVAVSDEEMELHRQAEAADDE